MNIVQGLRAELTERLIPFWQGMKDAQHGGYFGRMGFDLHIHRKADKGCIANSRILWFFSKAASFLQDDSLLSYATHAYQFMMRHFLDEKNGGVYWSVAYDGNPQDTTKHTYCQAFVVYALSAYYQATGDAKALQTAQGLFELMEKHCKDEGGYLEAFGVDFSPEENEKLSENGVLATRTMNTLLHVFEGYAGLYEAQPDERVEAAMRQIIELFLRHVFNPAKRRQEVFFDVKYQSLVDLHSYGHDIESAWLMEWGCSLLGDKALNDRLRPALAALAENVLQKGYHDGVVWNERENHQEDKTRVWWVQAEAMVGFCNAWQHAPQRTEYRDAMLSLWDYTKKNLLDPRKGGEWYWDVDEASVPSSRKDVAGAWKCPYHNGRMCMEIIRRLEA